MPRLSRRPPPLALALLLLLWVACGAMGLELLLQARSAIKVAFRKDTTRMAQLERAYQPFTTKHLHPMYLFFFPLAPEARLAIGNTVCSLDAEGFREPGPALAAGRKLAFLLGGSAAFGDYASSNATTITSYLNALQAEYFFVNAGVPSWNSTQELSRLAFQIADYEPALVVTYDGANDAALIGLSNERRATRYPAGTPESFDDLELLLDDGRHPARRFSLERLFPELTNRVEKYRDAFGDTDEASDEGPAADEDAMVDEAAHRYLTNLQRMSELSGAMGARFIAVFQPMAQFHRHVNAPSITRSPVRAAFHDRAFANPPRSFEFHDLSDVFDQYFPSVPVATPDIADDTVFVDDAHLSDRGNAIVARHLLRLIQPPARSTP